MTLIPRKAYKMFGAKKQYDVAKIDVMGTKMLAEYLGSGRFTTAFHVGQLGRSKAMPVILYTFHEDFSKSILAHTYREYGTKVKKHIPQITRLGRYVYRGHPCNVYNATYYESVVGTKLSKNNRRIIDTLQDLHDGACHKFKGNIIRTQQSDEFNHFICEGSAREGLPEPITVALEHLRFVAQDWGDHYIFDSFKERNLGLDRKGRLVFLDPMFDLLKIHRDHESRKRKERVMSSREKAQRRAIWVIDNEMS